MIVPMAMTVATLDPEMAAKIAQAITPAMPRPPVMPAVIASASVINLLATPASTIILLARIKKGMARIA